MNHQYFLTGLVFVGMCLATVVTAAPNKIDRNNYVIGTQTFGARYQFTNKSRIVETSQAILDMGSNILKFLMSDRYYGDA